MAIVTVGIDLAKNVFAVHGVDAAGKPALVRPSVARARLLELIAALPACAADIFVDTETYMDNLSTLRQNGRSIGVRR